jgi:hypothetical protein
MEENETAILLSLSEAIATIRSRDDLLTLINGKLKEIFPLIHGGIGFIEKNTGTYTVLLRDPPAIAMMQEPEVNFSTSSFPKNNLIDQVLGADSQVISNLDDLILTWEAPLYARLNHASAIKEIHLAKTILRSCRKYALSYP